MSGGKQSDPPAGLGDADPPGHLGRAIIGWDYDGAEEGGKKRVSMCEKTKKMRGAWRLAAATATMVWTLGVPLAAQPMLVSGAARSAGAVTAAAAPTPRDPELSVEIGPGNSYVVLENSTLRVEYLPFYADFDQFAIRHFTIKVGGGGDQVCGCGQHYYIDADAGRGVLADAWIVQDDDQRKTVHLEWFKNGDTSRRIIHEVSIYPWGCFIRVDYINVKYGTNLVDLGTPGGVMNGAHVAYGAADWVRGYVTHDYAPTVGSYYNRYPPDGVNDPADGGSLNYNDQFIVGVYNPANGIGFGRVAPVADTSILKLLLTESSRRGLELFPHPFGLSHQPFTGYIFGVTGGGEGELLSTGMMLADTQP